MWESLIGFSFQTIIKFTVKMFSKYMIKGTDCCLCLLILYIILQNVFFFFDVIFKFVHVFLLAKVPQAGYLDQ